MNGVNADGTKLIDAYIASGATTAAAAAEAGFVEANAMVAEATKVNEIKVTFASAVDKADIKFAVTRDGINVPTEDPEWDGSTVATVKTVAKMTAGKYTITATGASDEFKDSFEIKADEVNIVISNTTALTGEDGYKAYVYYDVLDQYGESIRSSISIQWSASTGSDSKYLKKDSAKGLLTLSRSDGKAFTYGEKIYITGVYARTGSSVQAEVSVGMTQALNSVEFEGFVKKGTTDILKTLPAGFKEDTYYLIYTAKDQNGNAFAADNPINGNEVTFISENPLLIKEIKKDDETKLILSGDEYNAAFVSPGMSVDQGGEATITVISNKTGYKESFNVAVGADQILTSFTLLTPSGVLADGEEMEIEFVALDQNGKEIENFVTLAKQSELNKLTFTASPGSLTLSEKDDGTAKLVYKDEEIKWSDSRSTDEIARIASLTSILVGGETDNLMLSIQDKARPVAIKEVKMDNVLVEDGSTTILFDNSNDSAFLFIDQYGREMDNDKAAAFFAASGTLKGSDFADYEFLVRATFKGTAGYFDFDFSDLTAVEGETVYYMPYDSDLTITAIGDVSNALSGFSLKFDIIKIKAADAQAVSPVRNEDLTIVDISAVRGFYIDEVKKFYIPTSASESDNGVMYGLKTTSTDAIYYIKAPATLEDIPRKYQHSISVKGTYNNADVNIASKYLNFSASKLVFDKFDKNKVVSTSDDAIKWSDFYDLGKFGFPRKDSDDTVTVKVLDASGKVRDTLSKKVGLSDENPTVTTIEVKDAVTLSPKNTVITVDDIEDKIDLKVKDQYGVEMTETASYKIASIVPNADGYAENNFKVSKNDSEVVEIVGAERGDTFTLTVTVGGKSKDVKVTVGADENANITGSKNNYIDELIGEAEGTTLEYQRIAGLQ
jgi:hypothetical protein